MEQYYTVGVEAQAEHIEKKSRFIDYCRPVKTEEEAVNFIAEIRKRHADARHNCYAYRLRDGQIQRYSDDGEPQGTAGIPILEVLAKQELTDCAVVVTRYFGGVLLGTGGLVRAYTKGAKLAVKESGIVEMCSCAQCEVTCDYGFYGTLQTTLLKFEAVTTDTVYADNVTVSFYLTVDSFLKLQDEITEKSFGKIKIQQNEIKFMPIARDFSETCE